MSASGGKSSNLSRTLGAVRQMSGIPDIHIVSARKRFSELRENRDSTYAGIKYANLHEVTLARLA